MRLRYESALNWNNIATKFNEVLPRREIFDTKYWFWWFFFKSSQNVSAIEILYATTASQKSTLRLIHSTFSSWNDYVSHHIASEICKSEVAPNEKGEPLCIAWAKHPIEETSTHCANREAVNVSFEIYSGRSAVDSVIRMNDRITKEYSFETHF